MHIYPRVLASLVSQGHLKESDSVLVVAGGDFDRQSMLKANIKNVTISNLAPHAGKLEYAPFDWVSLDAEKLDLKDGAYDWVVIHAGLHHLAVPALGICEMFRVARQGILCFESRDSWLMKLSVRLGLTSEYELEPAFLSEAAVGGYRNGPIPNYVYRWTEREFEKVVHSYSPTHQHKFFYRYGYLVPLQRFAMARNPLYKLLGFAIAKLTTLAEIMIPRQGNQFAFGVIKGNEPQPWLSPDLKFNQNYLAKKYDKAKYK